VFRVGLLGVTLLVVACSSRPTTDGEVRDHAGAGVALDGPARRIVSLSPALTELLFTLGAGDRVVGRTRWGQDPEAVLSIPSVGDGLNPNIEAVVAREPDLVLFYLSPSNSVAIKRLNGLGIATASVRLDGLADLVRAARLVGTLVDANTVDSVLVAFETRLEAVTARGDERPTVLLLAWDNPPIAIGAASFQSEIVERAGGRNVFADEARPSLPVSIETIAAREPDVVLLTGGEEPTFADAPEWQAVRAIRERRFVVVEGTQFAHPSFRAPDAIRELRRALERRR
jgi:iron complex transport system substrate-binding protein